MRQENEILTCQGIYKGYGGLFALHNLELHLPAGKIIALLGPNGSGKTTLFKLIAGLLTPDSGTILVNDEKIGVKTKAIVSYLPERNSLNESLTVRQTVELFAEFFEDFDSRRAIDMLNILHVDAAQKIKSLSKGTKEKVQLVLVMARRARLYLLDEPISGVDPAARDFIIHTILSNRNENSTVLLSTHLILDIEPYIDGFLFIQNGQIIRSGDAEETRCHEKKSLDRLFREVFRC